MCEINLFIYLFHLFFNVFGNLQGVQRILNIIVYSLKSVGIVTEYISDHDYTNKCNDCLNLICALNVYLNDEY